MRLRIPRGLASRVGVREIKKSLHTTDAHVADARAQPVVAAIQAHLAMTVEMDIKDLLKQLGSDQIQRWEADRITLAPDGSVLVDGVRIDPEKPGDSESFRETLASLHRQSAPPAPEYVRKSRDAVVVALAGSVLFSTVIRTYLDERQHAEAWTAKSYRENEAIYQLALRIIGDIECQQLDYGTARKFKADLQALPPNINKNPKFREKSLDEIKALAGRKTLSITTINKCLNRMSSLGDWMMRHGYIQQNVFSGLTIKAKQRNGQRSERAVFSRLELNKIFTHPIFLGHKRPLHTYYYWLPLIALHSGLRITEAAQLYLSDIRTHDGILVFDINDDTDKQVKTDSAIRLGPVHDYLLALGLENYIKELSKKGEKRLFPSLKPGRDGYGHNPLKWHARFLHDQIGIRDRTKVFYSYRHTFINRLQKQEISEEHVATLVGHSYGQTESWLRYGKGFSLSVLQAAVHRADFSDPLGTVVPFGMLGG